MMVLLIGAYAPIAPSLTPKAHASGLPVIDIANLFSNSSSEASNLTTSSILNILNGIAWQAAKMTIQVMTKSIVNWINSGYQGSPTFVTNLDDTLLSVANASATSFIRQLASNGSIKSPFQTQVASAVQNSYNLRTNGGFFASNPYTLNQTTSNPEAFLGGNFSQGGFNSWISAWSNPSNNPYGAYQLASNALDSQTSSARNTRLTELNWAKGFLSFRGSCAVTSGAGGGTTQDLTLPSTDANGNIVDKVSATASTNLSTNDNCISYNIQTPGSVIESQLENTLGSPIRQLELANSVNEIIGAAVTQLTTSVLGSTGLFGLSQNTSSTNNNAPINAVTDPSAYGQSVAATSAGVQQAVVQQQSQLSQFQTNWATIQNAAQQAANALQTSSCYPGAQTVLITQVQPVIDQAAAQLARATTAQNSLSSIQKEVTSASTPASLASANGVTASLAATNDYQSFLSSAATPSAQDIAYSIAQSTDTSSASSTLNFGPGATNSASLYTEMLQITKAAQTCTVAHG
jgi:hypothetical protein